MCKVYETVSIIGKETKVERHTVKCDEKSSGGMVEQCLRYKFTPTGFSRKKKGLPAWASGKLGNKGDSGGAAVATSG